MIVRCCVCLRTDVELAYTKIGAGPFCPKHLAEAREIQAGERAVYSWPPPHLEETATVSKGDA